MADALTPAQRRSLVEWLGRKVMGWEGEIGHWRIEWPFAGMVWDKAREMQVFAVLRGQVDHRWYATASDMKTEIMSGNVFADSGPLAISLAIARATGFEATQ